MKIKRSNSQNPPATEELKARLRYFGCKWNGDITKAQASKMIDEYVERFPFWKKLAATEEQLAKLRSMLTDSDGELEDYCDPQDLNYGEAKKLIRIWENDREVET